MTYRMQFTCAMEQLVSAVSNVQRAVAAKSAVPALEGILLRTTHNALFIAGFDMELGITTTIPASVKEIGEIVVSSRLFGDIVRKMPGDSVSFSCDEKGNTTIRSEMTSFTISGISAADYPELPSVNDGVGFTLPQDVLKSMIRQTLFAVAQPNDPRPICTGTKFELADGKLKLISVDGYRLAMRSEAIDSEENISFVVPGKTLQEVLKLLGDEESPVSFAVGKRHVVMSIDGYAVISRLLDGEFMAYERTIPKEIKTTVFANTRMMMNAVDRASLVINDRMKSPLVCDFKDNVVNISCSTPLGSASDYVEVRQDGKSELMGFNSRFLLDALKNSETDEIRIELNGALSPMKILPAEGDSFLFLVLPVRLKNSAN